MERWRVVLFPVRRRLAALAVCWLTGVAIGYRTALPGWAALVLCALLALAAAVCRRICVGPLKSVWKVLTGDR